MIATIVFLFLFLPLVIIVITSFGTEGLLPSRLKDLPLTGMYMALRQSLSCRACNSAY